MRIVKALLLLIFLFLTAHVNFAQVDTSVVYPLQIGNLWDYSTGGNEIFKTVVDTVTLSNAKRYAKLKCVNLRHIGETKFYFLREENKKIYCYESYLNKEVVKYDLSVPADSFWFTEDIPGYGYVVDKYKTFNDWLGDTTYYYRFLPADIDTSVSPPIISYVVDVSSIGFLQGIGVAYEFFHVLQGAKIGNKIYGHVTVGVEKSENEIPTKFELFQNYPNPFNPSTNIVYQIPKAGFVQIKVFDVLGREVTTLVNEEQTPGKYEITFKAGNLTGGVYLLEMSTGGFVQTRKMLLVK